MGGDAYSGTRSSAHLRSNGGTLDRRHDSHRATRRRRAAEDALLDELLFSRDETRDSVGSEGQALLMKALAKQHNVEMPIADAVHAVLFDGLSPREGVDRLMQRPSVTE